MNLKQGFESNDDEVVRQIVAAIKKIRFGSVEIVVHDSKVVQIESREKIRFDKK